MFFLLGISRNLAAAARKFWKNLHYVFFVEGCVLPYGTLVAGICFAFHVPNCHSYCFGSQINTMPTYFYRESSCQTHAVTCGAGTGVYLLIRVSPLSLSLSCGNIEVSQWACVCMVFCIIVGVLIDY